MLLDGIVELLFPPRCAACDAPGAVLCDSCASMLPLITEGRACPLCGAPMDDICAECVGRSFSFSACRTVGLFKPPLSSVVTVYKDGGERRLIPVIGALVASRLAEWAEWADAIVPVPPRPAAKSTRGFDHMGLVVRDVAARTGLPVRASLEVRNAADQRQLGRDDRFANALGRYTARGDATLPQRLLLVDDVFTTGATLEACAAVLLRSGAAEVRAVAFARATDVVLP